MKNILAENMLRFGAKNLHKSDIKKIEKAIVNEDVVLNGVTYKFPFKDMNQLNSSYLGSAPWNENAAAAAGRFNKQESADYSTLMTLRAVYGDILLELAKRGTTPQILKAKSDQVNYISSLMNIVSPNALTMIRQKGGWATMDAIRTNVLGNPKVKTWISNWFIPTFEKAFTTTFPQGIPTAAPTNPQAPGAPKPGM